MQGISIFQQIYAPRVAHVVTDFDGVSHNTHSPYAMGGAVGSTGKMTAIVANDQADTWHIVNLKRGNLFDAVAVLGAFDESEAANMAMRYHGQYFDAVCGDVCESNTGGLQRFLNHPVYMRTNRPVYAEELAKLQDVPSTQAILWDGVQLKSHNGSSKHLLLDMMRCDDDKALLEKMDFVEEESQLDGEIAEYDALVVEAYKLESTVSKLALAMDKATSISTLKVAKQTLSKPKTMRGFGVIQQLVSFELSDGQAVSIIFNVSDSEANASAKMTKDDLLVAWKYKLNSRDITAAVQPNATQNVSLNMIASRIMGLADANSEKFVAAQKKKDAMQTELANTNQRVKDLQSQEQALLQEIADLQKQLDEKAKMVATEGEKNANDYSFVRDDFDKQKYRLVDADGKELQVIWKSGATWAMATGESFKTLVEAKQAAIDNAKFWMKMQQEEATSRAEIEGMGKVVQSAPQDRPTDYRTNLESARDVAKSLGLETKGKKLVDLVALEAENAQSQERIAGILAENAAIQKEIDAVVQHKDKPNGIPTNEVEALLKIGRKWEKGGHSRIYFDVNMPAAIGLSISRYKTGNISSAVWADGEKISNTKATDLIDGLMVYFDINKGEFVKGNRTSEEHADLIIEKIKSQAGILAENAAIQKEIDAVVQHKDKPNGIPTNEVEALSNLSDDEYKAKEAKPLAPVEKAQQAKKDAFLNTEVDSAYGTVTKKQLLDNLINDGWTLSTGWTEDKAKGKALDAEFDRLKRTAPWGNTSHPDTIRLNELKKLAKESPHKDYGRFLFKETVYHLESPTGKLKSLSKTELDYVNDALAKKDTVPKATTVSNKKAVFDVLTQYGWKVDTVLLGGISKTFAGLAEAGAISDGSRTLHADFDSRERYLAVTDNNAPTGGAIIPETEIDLRDYGYDAEGFAKAAKAFNEKVEVYVLNRREALNAPKTNPDRDYLQSIIDGKADLSNADEIEAKLTDISERLDDELEPLFEQAAEAFAQYAIAQAAKVI